MIYSRVLSVLLLIFVGASLSPVSQAQNLPSVVSSFFVNFVFVNAVAGDLVNLDVAVGPGLDPHEFEPNVQDVEKIQNANMFVYNGAGFENPWVDPLLDNGTINPNSQVIVETIRLVNENGDLIEIAGEDEENFETNPHIWLDPVLASEIIRTIEDGLVQLNPENEMTFRNNAQAFRGDLGVLDLDYQAGLALCDQNTIVQSHAFLDYLARQYGFDVITASGIEPEEPSVAGLEAVIQFVRDNNVNFLFTESQDEADLTGLQQVSDATGAEILFLEVFEGFEGDVVSLEDIDYFAVMRENLEALSTGLECE